MATPPTSFAKDIRPLFRDKDINSMKKAFDLSRYDDVQKYADAILGRVAWHLFVNQLGYVPVTIVPLT